VQATQAGAEKQLAQTAVRLQSSIGTVALLEKDLEAAGEKFTFLQEMKAYIADLCDMLQVSHSDSLYPY
jgi:GC-rich sequence DNA-binding factor